MNPQKEIFEKFGATQQQEDPIRTEHKDLTEELLAEYATVKSRLEALAQIQLALRKRILELAKDQTGAIQRGEWTLVLRPRAGSVTVDYEQYIVDQVGEDAIAEINEIKAGVKAGTMTSPWVKQGKSIVNVEVVRGQAKSEKAEDDEPFK